MKDAEHLDSLTIIKTISTGNGICCAPGDYNTTACNKAEINEKYGPSIKLTCLYVEDFDDMFYPNSIQPLSLKSSMIYD
jgi:hypothetical protein